MHRICSDDHCNVKRLDFWQIYCLSFCLFAHLLRQGIHVVSQAIELEETIVIAEPLASGWLILTSCIKLISFTFEGKEKVPIPRVVFVSAPP